VIASSCPSTAQDAEDVVPERGADPLLPLATSANYFPNLNARCSRRMLKGWLLWPANTARPTPPGYQAGKLPTIPSTYGREQHSPMSPSDRNTEHLIR